MNVVVGCFCFVALFVFSSGVVASIVVASGVFASVVVASGVDASSVVFSVVVTSGRVFSGVVGAIWHCRQENKNMYFPIIFILNVESNYQFTIGNCKSFHFPGCCII